MAARMSKVVADEGASRVKVKMPKVEDYGGPVKNRSAYSIYQSEHKAELTRKGKQLAQSKGNKYDQVKDFSAASREAWANLSPLTQQTYINKAREAADSHDMLMAEWMKTDQYAQYEGETIRKQKAAAEKQVKRNAQAAGLPKKPPTTFFVFSAAVREHRRKQGLKVDIMEISAEATGRWKTMGDREKKQYEDEAARLSQKYERDLAAFKQTDAWKLLQAAKTQNFRSADQKKRQLKESVAAQKRAEKEANRVVKKRKSSSQQIVVDIADSSEEAMFQA